MSEYPWMAIARKYEKKGVHEISGPAANPDIVSFLQSTDLPPEMADSDETAWCSAFVNDVIEEAGYKGTNSAAASSWNTWGKEADWGNLQGGEVVTIHRQGGSGYHVGLFQDSDDDTITLLAGNQHDSVCYAKFRMGLVAHIRVPKET